MNSSGDLFGVVIVLVALPLFLWAYSRIASRAGFSPWWALAVLVPLVNVVVVLVFAFSAWPVERRAEEAERRVRSLEDAARRERPLGFGR
jgi:uncharacterized membrane protein